MAPSRSRDLRLDNEARYDRMAAGYERRLRFASLGTIGRLHRALADAVEVPAGGRLVEVGCGPGNVTPHLLEKLGGVRILGFDLSGEMVRLARRRAEREGWRGVAYVRADAATFAPPEPVDAVVFSLVLSGLPEPLACVDRALSWLVPGGRLAVLDSFLRPGWHVSNWVVRSKAPYVGAVPEDLPLDGLLARLERPGVRWLHRGSYAVVSGAKLAGSA